MWKIVFSAIFSAALMYALVMFGALHTNVVVTVIFGVLAGVMQSLLRGGTVALMVSGIVLLPLGWFVSGHSTYLGLGFIVAGVGAFATILGGYIASYFPEEP